MQVKINAQYSQVGVVPGITVDEFKRKKILKDLEAIPNSEQQETTIGMTKQPEEEVEVEVDDSLPLPI